MSLDMVSEALPETPLTPTPTPLDTGVCSTAVECLGVTVA